VSTISEWLTAAAVVLFVLTFYPSFKTITLQSPKVISKVSLYTPFAGPQTK
jgi:hypothetical protein